MTKLKQFIVKISKKGNIKVMLVFLLVAGFFFGQTFAAGDTESDKKLLAEVLTYLVKMLSWFWIILANLAGKFMTNGLLYGEFLHLDVTLYTLWNIMKNFANFGLGFILIYSVLINIFKREGANKVFGVVKNALISGVLIQMSWFIVGATVDISTILTTAIGSFPAQIIASSDDTALATDKGLKKLLNGNMIKVSPEGKVEVSKKEGEINEDDMKSLVDSILPTSDSLAGPLIFLGISAFNFMDVPSVDVGETSWSKIFLQIGLDGIVLLAYSVMMFFIFLFNLLRLLVLRVVIPLTPLIILVSVFKSKLPLGDFLTQIIKVENIFKLIFKPVIMVGALSVVLIVLVLVKNIINHDNTKIFIDSAGVEIQSANVGTDDRVEYDSSLSLGELVNFNMNGFKDSIADIFIYVLGLCLVYFLVKMAVRSGTGIKFIDEKMNKLMDNVGGFLSNVPIIPVGGGKYAGVGVVENAIKQRPGIGIDNMTRDQTKILQNDERFKWLFPNLASGTIFGDLDTNSTREEFIKTAHSIAVSHNLINKGLVKDTDQSLQLKINEWNSKNAKNKPDIQIQQKHIADYKPKESE